MLLYCSFSIAKKRQCNKYYNGVPNSKMSDVENIYFVYQFISDAESQINKDSWLQYIRLLIRATGNASVNPAVDECPFRIREEWGSKEREMGSTPHSIFFAQDTLGL